MSEWSIQYDEHRSIYCYGAATALNILRAASYFCVDYDTDKCLSTLLFHLSYISIAT